MKRFNDKNFLYLLFRRRKMILTMAMTEIKVRYLGTLAGILWCIIHPIVMACVFWIVFGSLFKSAGVQYELKTVPYICYFLSGFAPWTLLNDSLMSSTNSIVGNPHYVKKIVFPTEMLPVINLLASLVSQVAIFAVLFIIMLRFNLSIIHINYLKLFYFFLLLSIFSIGISWITASLNVFYRDTAQVLTVILNIWFWVTPVVYASTLLPPKINHLIKFNTVFYIIEGYRDSLLNTGNLEYANINWDFYHLSVVLIIAFIGKHIFNRLKPEFADII